MRFPWQLKPEPEPERRAAGGSYSDAITAAIEARASAKVADVSATAAIEAAAGALSRAFAAAVIIGPDWVQEAVNPVWLGQVGRSLIREGASLSVIAMGSSGQVDLTPAAFWNFEAIDVPGAELERDWNCRVTTYGPSSSSTRLLPRDQLVFIRWGTSPGTRYRGQGPTSWAHLSARLHGETERSLADEASGPIANLLPIPDGQDGGDGSEDDPLAMLKADIAKARGKTLLLETTAAGFGEGMASAPRKDWVSSRLGPNPPAGMATIAEQAFARMLAACGVPPGMFESGADGTSQREALRRWHQNTVLPLARILEFELSARLETSVRLKFDLYATDLQGRATTFQKLVSGGTSVNEALTISGLLADET